MEMESSRRSAMDRAREPGLKKPRLADDSERDRGSNGVATADRDRPLPRDPRLGGGGGGQSLNPRFRPGEREREDTARGAGSYEELMSQYKTALAELTFNSKPIITNLTIIAGENQHAAKGITATICANILEVPSEQKLPSLYLLDSIVKNIAKDYVKYFAARLPEVFCKAYKQVDSSIHSGMRHLFGTWKGVFPSAPLQIIEKELGFPPIINGSSGATTSKPESQTTQRPSHSIHVNPKYLEARQRLQQSSKAKDTSSDDTSGVADPVDDAEGYARTAIVGSTRQRTELPIKMLDIQRPQREHLNYPIHDKKGHRDVRDHEFSPELSRQSSDLGVGRVNEKVKERDGLDKPYYGAGGTASVIPTSRMNDFDVGHVDGAYRPSGSAQIDHQLPSVHLNNTNKSSRPTPKNWKNSEEEDFMWDDVNSRLTDYGGANNTIKGGWNNDDVDKPASLQGGKWMPEHLDSQWNKFDTFLRFRKTPGGEERLPLFRDSEEHLPQPRVQQDPDSRINIETTADPFSLGRAASGHHTSSVWPPREPPPSVVGLNHMSSRISGQSEGHFFSRTGGFITSSSLPRLGPLSHSIPSSGGLYSGPVGMFGQQRQQPLQPPSPSAQSPPPSVPIQHPRSHNSMDHDHLQSNSFSQMGQKPTQLPGQLNRAPQAPSVRDSFPILPQSHTQKSRISLNSQSSQQLQTSSASSASLTQMRHHLPFLHSSKPDVAQQAQPQSQPSIQTEKPPLSLGTHQMQEFSGTSLSNNPVDVSGQSSTSNLLAAIMKSGLLSNYPASSLQNPNSQPPLPSGPPPIQVLTSSAPLVTPSSLTFPTSHGKAPALVPPPMRAVLPPLPPGPPPASSLVATTSQVSNTASATPNPLSGLLSSLLAKGVISSPATELPAVTSAQMPNKLPNQSSGFPSSALAPVPSTSATSTIPPSSVKELNISESSPATEFPAVTSAQMPNKLPNQSSGFPSSALVVVPSTSATSTIPPSSVKELNISESSAPTTATELENLIGFDFKPEIIREFHPLVINSLLDDLRHQCTVCGLRFRLQEQLHNHLDWHASKKSETTSFEGVSRKWFADKNNWVAGNMGPPCGPVATVFIEEVAPGGEKCEEPMVPADESQSICALCGEPFEDFYSDKRDGWMYKGTVYLNSVHRQGDIRSEDESMGPGLIVHAKCVSSSVNNVEVTGLNKVGWTDS